MRYKYTKWNMTKKSTKPTRAEQYRQILAEYGKRLEDCKVLAFAFDTEHGPEIFHYELMFPLRPVYHLFDCFGNIAQIVVPKDPENEDMAVKLAESCGGEKTTPNLI